MDLFTYDNANIKKEPDSSEEREVVMDECSDKLHNVGNEKGLKNKAFVDSNSLESEVDLSEKELFNTDIIEREVFLKEKGIVDSNIVVDNEVTPKIKLVNSHAVEGELHLGNKGPLDLNTVKVKTEPENVDEGDIAVMYTEVEIEYPDVKKECADIYNGEGTRINQSESNPNSSKRNCKTVVFTDKRYYTLLLFQSAKNLPLRTILW